MALSPVRCSLDQRLLALQICPPPFCFCNVLRYAAPQSHPRKIPSSRRLVNSQNKKTLTKRQSLDGEADFFVVRRFGKPIRTPGGTIISSIMQTELPTTGRADWPHVEHI